jgi:hypothetical protein
MVDVDLFILLLLVPSVSQEEAHLIEHYK